MSSANRRLLRALAGAGLVASAAAGAVVLSAPASAQTESQLHASASAPAAAVAPGGTGTFHYEVTNTGTTATQGVLMNIDVPFDVALPVLKNNRACETTGDDGAGGTLVSCSVTDAQGKLQPGQTVSQEVSFTVAGTAPGPQELGKVGVLVVPEDASGKPTEDWHKTDGPNTVWVPISTTANHEDYSVGATKASGKVGDTVTVTATGTNNGPADVVGGTVTVTAPTGTELTQLPKDFSWVEQGRKAKYTGAAAIVPAGKSATLDLKFTITNSIIGNDGSVTAIPTSGDANTADDTAPIAITSTGGSGAGDGSPTLPVTGTNTAAIAGGGAAVVLAGAFLAFFGYRRVDRARHTRT
jgi:hypothetical protein